jgi:hypothetical protein
MIIYIKYDSLISEDINLSFAGLDRRYYGEFAELHDISGLSELNRIELLSGDLGLGVQLQLALDPSEHVRANLADACLPGVQVKLASDSLYVRRRLASSRNICLLAAKELDGVELAKNINIGLDIQEMLFERGSSERLELASNVNIFESIQLKLLDYPPVWPILAINPSIVESVQLELFDELLDRYLAQNPSISIKLQLLLMDSSDVETRCYLAKNLLIDKAIQLRLAKDSDFSVRDNLLSNDNICKEARLLVLEDVKN